MCDTSVSSFSELFTLGFETSFVLHLEDYVTLCTAQAKMNKSTRLTVILPNKQCVEGCGIMVRVLGCDPNIHSVPEEAMITLLIVTMACIIYSMQIEDSTSGQCGHIYYAICIIVLCNMHTHINISSFVLRDSFGSYTGREDTE